MRKLVAIAIFLLALTSTYSVEASTVEPNKKEIMCMAEAMYAEARGEHEVGMRAVGHVIMNRVHSGKFQDTPCETIGAKGQFTYNHKKPISDKKTYDIALKIASSIYNGQDKDITCGATAFHVRTVKPKWRLCMEQTAVIGHQIFYKSRKV